MEWNDWWWWGNCWGIILFVNYNSMILICVVLVLVGIYLLYFVIGVNNMVKLVVLFLVEGFFFFVKYKVFFVIDIVVKVVENCCYFLDYNIVINFWDDECLEIWGFFWVIDLYVEKNVDVYLGLCCDFVVVFVVCFFFYWNIFVFFVGVFV